MTKVWVAVTVERRGGVGLGLGDALFELLLDTVKLLRQRRQSLERLVQRRFESGQFLIGAELLQFLSTCHFFVEEVVLSQHLTTLLQQPLSCLRVFLQRLPQILFRQHEEVRVADAADVRRTSVAVLVACDERRKTTQKMLNKTLTRDQLKLRLKLCQRWPIVRNCFSRKWRVVSRVAIEHGKISGMISIKPLHVLRSGGFMFEIM